MNNKTSMFGVAVLILALVTAAILGLVTSPGNPLTWLLVLMLMSLPFLYRKLTTRQFVEWKDEYSVGIDSIDQQHRKLLNLINSLQTAVNYKTGSEFEREALDELVDYTKTHFSYEEGLMERYEYPEFTTHRAEHELMISRVDQVLAEYQQDEDTAMQNAIDFLKDWLINHINGTDQKYASFLIEKGAK
ncbi:MAG: hemerythrin family protein [Gammaproteobacteria bacterium]|nr:hemerythrin family protein [Gammaproteobacteria bacterium]